MIMLIVKTGSRTTGETSNEEIITEDTYITQHNNSGSTTEFDAGRHCFAFPQTTSSLASGNGALLAPTNQTVTVYLDQSVSLPLPDTDVMEINHIEQLPPPPEPTQRTASPGLMSSCSSDTHLHIRECDSGEFSSFLDSTTDDHLFPYPTPGECTVTCRTPSRSPSSDHCKAPSVSSEESVDRTADLSSDEDSVCSEVGKGQINRFLPRCWLCGDSDPQEDLFRACECPANTGLLHKHCLLDWINTLYKGRCPRCAYMYRVVTDKTPWTKWKADTLLIQRRSRHIAAFFANLALTALTALALMLLLVPNDHTNSISQNVKLVLAALVGLTFFFYTFYQVRLYMRMYERLKIFNNRVWDVCDVEEGKNSNCQARGNLSEMINQSELNHNEFSSRGIL